MYVSGMMCQGNCGTAVERALRDVPGVVEATAVAATKRATAVVEAAVKDEDLVAAVDAIGFAAKIAEPETKVRRVKLRVDGMMCDKNCGATVIRALKAVPGVQEAMASAKTASANALVEQTVKDADLVAAVEAVGFSASIVQLGAFLRRKTSAAARKTTKPRHACIRDVVPAEELAKAFEGVKKYYHEQQLQEYSRYKNWTQSCYMDCHEHWSPQVPITEPLRDCMAPVMERCRLRFKSWYEELHGLKNAEVYALNSFVTKYIPVEGKQEFGKHVDSAKCDGSLIVALPTDDPHDWPGIKIWDGPRNEKGEQPEQTYVLQPGDICCLDALVWHHGLPISKGVRYVAVCFFRCKWKEVKGADATNAASA
ncbi:Copper-transporting ATPase RAN1 [Hondaea fermentalgiana]|uniref:Copper-transporting ATPase RAN1 n=1 Tax=Hondaea fermentalgiana TaxID=2315210 RepID=A0A2R5GWW6_9STRA|nr:Copper-transporting ATPase RAN1 [Hondaea fermentalgiana]|eukprot:GBG32901.1 Copper-transporting ATPase RAN1 [Hondaea fermentalgiana]